MNQVIPVAEPNRKKTFYVTNVRAYLKIGAVRGHIDPDLIAAGAFFAAKVQGCEEIKIEMEGLSPVVISVAKIEEMIKKNPERYAGWIPRPVIDKIHAIRNGMNLAIFQGNLH